MTENEFGHKDWPTVPGEKTLAKIRELVEAPVWVLVYNHAYDSGHYRASWDEWNAAGEYGFFRTEEAAQAKADALNGYEEKYRKIAEHTERVNREHQDSFNKRQEAWDTLEEKGLNPIQFMAKPKLVQQSILPFEEWKAIPREESYYSVEKVEFSGGE